MLDVTSNEISTVHAFGKEINLSKVYLDYNQIDKIEDVDGYYCGYYDMESFTCSYNQLKEVPNIFNAASKYTIGSVNFSHNQITGLEDGDSHRGINTSNLTFRTIT